MDKIPLKVFFRTVFICNNIHKFQNLGRINARYKTIKFYLLQDTLKILNVI